MYSIHYIWDNDAQTWGIGRTLKIGGGVGVVGGGGPHVGWGGGGVSTP